MAWVPNKLTGWVVGEFLLEHNAGSSGRSVHTRPSLLLAPRDVVDATVDHLQGVQPWQGVLK